MTQNLMANYQHPAPIIVERVGGQGQHAVPSKIQTEKLQGCKFYISFHFVVMINRSNINVYKFLMIVKIMQKL